VLLAGVVLAFSTTPVVARAGPGDVASTTAYLKAKDIEVRAETTALPAGGAALEAFDDKLAAECPGVLANAPHPAPGPSPTRSGVEIYEEEILVIARTQEHAEHSALAHFAKVVGRLRWSNRELTLMVHLQASERAEQVQVELPDLCADLKFWVASGYQTVSASTKQFLHRTEGGRKFESAGIIPIDLGERIARLLASYQNAADKAVGRSVKHLETENQRRWIKQLFVLSAEISRTLNSAPAKGLASHS
jgi:hypothetical protein